jgi:hypothetical protein
LKTLIADGTATKKLSSENDVDGGMRVEPEEMLEEQWIAAEMRIENAHAEEALQRNERERDRKHRRGQDEDQAGGIERPDKERQPEPGHARRAQLVHRDDEIESGENRREAVDENAHRHRNDPAVGVGAAVGRVERPAGVDAAEQNRRHGEQPAEHEDVPADEVEARKGHVAGADHQREQKIPQHVGNRRDEEKPDHDHPVHGEKLVVGVGGEEIPARMNQLQSHQHRGDAADEKEERDRRQVKQRDALVIVREEPRAHRLLVVEVGLRRQRKSGLGGHGVLPAAGVGVLRSERI